MPKKLQQPVVVTPGPSPPGPASPSALAGTHSTASPPLVVSGTLPSEVEGSAACPLPPSVLSTPHSKRLVLVDDHALVREGLAEAIKRELDLTICGEAETALEARQIIERTHPDLVIVDLALKKSDGLDLIKDLHLQHPDLLMLVVSMHDEGLFAERALRNGARGYITKHEASHTVIQAIRRVLSGDIYLSDEMLTQIAAQVVGKARHSKGLAVEALSDRELQVFRLIGQGRSTREIAAELHLDISTIDTYRARIKEKLGLESASELLRKAIGWTHGSSNS